MPYKLSIFCPFNKKNICNFCTHMNTNTYLMQDKHEQRGKMEGKQKLKRKQHIMVFHYFITIILIKMKIE